MENVTAVKSWIRLVLGIISILSKSGHSTYRRIAPLILTCHTNIFQSAIRKCLKLIPTFDADADIAVIHMKWIPHIINEASCTHFTHLNITRDRQHIARAWSTRSSHFSTAISLTFMHIHEAFHYFLFQKITMFHFACGLLIINEDLQYARIIFSSCRFSSITGTYKYNLQCHAFMVYSREHVGNVVYSCAYDPGFNNRLGAHWRIPSSNSCVVDCVIGRHFVVCVCVCVNVVKKGRLQEVTRRERQKGRKRFFHTLHFYLKK